MAEPGTYHIKGSNGGVYEVQAADDAHAQELEKFINERIAAGDPDLNNGPAPANTQINQGQAPDARPTSFAQGVSDGASDVVNNAARFLESGLEKIPGYETVNNWVADATGMAHSVDEAVQHQQTERDAAPYQGSGAGEFVGQMAATAPAALLPGGPMAVGAVMGGLTTKARDPLGVATDMALGSIGGKVGDSVMRGAARYIAPKALALGDNVRKLIGEGVTAITPGQVARDSGTTMGRIIANVEDSQTGKPFVGSLVTRDREVAGDQLNRAFVNRVLKPLNDKLPDGVATGHEAIRYAGDKLSTAYETVLPKLSGQQDVAFTRRVSALRARASLPADYDKQVQAVMDEASNAFTAGARGSQNSGGALIGTPGNYTGRTLRDASDRLDKLASGWSVAEDPYLRQVGEFAGQVREQLRSLARRQNPAAADELRAVDKAYAMLVRVEGAAKNAKGGIASPGQFTTAVRTADRSARKRAVGRGEALLQDLSDAASTVMPSQIGNSGTNDRASASILGYADGAVRTIPYLLAKRDVARAGNATPGQQYVADLLRRGAPVAGQASATATPQKIRSISQP